MAAKPTAEIGTHQRGRPASQQGVRIDQLMRDYYSKGASAEFVIQETGLNKNTVYSKFKELSDMIRRTNEKEFAEKYEEERSQYILSVDQLIFRTYRILTYIEEKIEKYHRSGSEIPEFLLQKFSDITKNLLNMKKEKASYTMKPSFDENLKNKIKEVLENLESN